MKPRVIIHNAVSLDGRIDGFDVDMAQYYELASTWKEDATLVGCNTILKAEEQEEVPEEEEDVFEPPKTDPEDKRPLLVIPDSRGRIRIWHYIRKWPYWRKHIALCSKATPEEYLDYLKKRHIEFMIFGDEHVDLKTSLEELNSKYKVNIVRVDSGGTLNGVLLGEGLVDEVSVLIHPDLVGGTSPLSIFGASDPTSKEIKIKLKLSHLENLKDDLVWLRYKVNK
ncbi:MAG: RibD family protein [Thermoplasmata archaeon]|nr:MAG: RibD family protein [Thermoplasmata archaeon]